MFVPSLHHERGEGEGSVPLIVHEVLRSPGSPLDHETRTFMESRFGHDFSQVRVHTDARAAESARAVNALAYTVERDVVFGAGRCAPYSGSGKQLLAHELAHVVQQGMTAEAGQTKLVLDEAGDRFEGEAEHEARGIDPFGATPPTTSHQGAEIGIHLTAAPAGRVQRQFVTPLGPGGGFGGLLERDRRAAFSPNPPAPSAPSPVAETCSFQLCFLPLEVLLQHGVSPELSYATANHAFIRWNGASAAFTRLTGESSSDARVISPEPRAGEQHERCLPARFRTIPTPTPGQIIHFSQLDAVGDLISYGIDVVHGLQHCTQPGCALARRRITRMLTDDRRGLYDLFDENCETWARNVLAAACLEAPEFRLGGVGNQIFRILILNNA